MSSKRQGLLRSLRGEATGGLGREWCDLTHTLSRLFQSKRASREASEETVILTIGMAAQTRELVVEVMRSDWVQDVKKNVWESDVRDDPRFWPEQVEKDSRADLREARSSALKTFLKELRL